MAIASFGPEDQGTGRWGAAAASPRVAEAWREAGPARVDSAVRTGVHAGPVLPQMGTSHSLSLGVWLRGQCDQTGVPLRCQPCQRCPCLAVCHLEKRCEGINPRSGTEAQVRLARCYVVQKPRGQWRRPLSTPGGAPSVRERHLVLAGHC